MLRPIIFDCDPGNDDAVALLVTFASPEEFNVLGVTVVAGNVGLEQTTINARQICELADRADIPVYAGSSRPLVQEPIVSDGAHGVTGLDGATLPAPKMPLQDKHAIDFMVETLLSSSQKVTLCLTAPLTNLAMAMRKDPRILDHIEEMVIMGGSIAEGNITHAAEFNFFSDPESARIVLASGIKTTVIPLDITHQVTVDPKRVDLLRSIGNEAATQVANMMEETMAFDQEMFNLPGRAVHDVCVPIYLLKPHLFDVQPVSIQIETESKDSRGNSYISFAPRHLHENPWVQVPTNVQADAVFDLIVERLARYDSFSEPVKNILR